MKTTTIALAASVVLATMIAVALLTGYAGWYHAMNTGVFVGRYGFEFVGAAGPGFFHCDELCGFAL